MGLSRAEKTVDPLFGAWNWNALGDHAKPFALHNISGFRDGMMSFETACAKAAAGAVRQMSW